MAGAPSVEVPVKVRRAALFPHLDLPDPPPGHPFELARRDGYALGSFAGATFGMVLVERIDPGRLDRLIAEARVFMGERGKRRIDWMVPEEAEPKGLADVLRSLGMVPCDEPPGEPRAAAMAVVEAPAAGPVGVEARLACSFEEFHAATHIADEAFELSEDDRAATLAAEAVLWELQCSEQPVERTFVALVDGEVVGAAGVIFGSSAGYLAGGSTRPDMRGRGIYRALVRARWEAVLERGTPALTVTAGRMSRPILERLGFRTIGWVDCLLDRFDHESAETS